MQSRARRAQHRTHRRHADRDAQTLCPSRRQTRHGKVPNRVVRRHRRVLRGQWKGVLDVGQHDVWKGDHRSLRSGGRVESGRHVRSQRPRRHVSVAARHRRRPDLHPVRGGRRAADCLPCIQVRRSARRAPDRARQQPFAHPTDRNRKQHAVRAGRRRARGLPISQGKRPVRQLEGQILSGHHAQQPPVLGTAAHQRRGQMGLVGRLPGARNVPDRAAHIRNDMRRAPGAGPRGGGPRADLRRHAAAAAGCCVVDEGIFYLYLLTYELCFF